MPLLNFASEFFLSFFVWLVGPYASLQVSLLVDALRSLHYHLQVGAINSALNYFSHLLASLSVSQFVSCQDVVIMFAGILSKKAFCAANMQNSKLKICR